MGDRWIFRNCREGVRQAVGIQIVLGNGAPGPAIGTQFGWPAAFHPLSRVSLIQGMAVFMGDDRDNGAITVPVMDRGEELWGVNKLGLIRGYNQHGIGRSAIAEHRDLRAFGRAGWR